MSKQEEIKQALAAATPGPWGVKTQEIWHLSSKDGEPHIYICSVDESRPEDVNLMAKAPEYIAYLLAENEQLEKRNQELDAWATEGFEENKKLVEERDRLRKAITDALKLMDKKFYGMAHKNIVEVLGQEGEGNQDANGEA